MMLFLIDITPIFSLSHLEKQRMETLQKIIQNQKKRVYTTCISLVYHVYITTSKQRKLSSIYEYSDNSHVFQYIKKSPINAGFTGLLHIIFILEILN